MGISGVNTAKKLRKSKPLCATLSKSKHLLIMETFEFPVSMLERAKQITLADLIDTPFTQPWAVSMMCNATNPATDSKHENVASEMLEFKLSQLVRSIPAAERNELFKFCGDTIAANRAARTKK